MNMDRPTSGGLIEHIERHLGTIIEGWPEEIDGVAAPCMVVRTERGPTDGSQTLVTLGLSKSLLALSDDRTVRLELVVAFRDRARVGHFPGVLRDLARECVQRGKAVARGQVLGPRGTLVEDTRLAALYVSNPVYFPAPFRRFDPPSGGPIVFVWLVPITAAEADYVGTHGWQAFEQRLEEVDPDLLDFDRADVAEPEGSPVQPESGDEHQPRTATRQPTNRDEARHRSGFARVHR